jgi:DNA-binding XRE family transcriptional regulator
MLAVVKTPRTSVRIKGQISNRLIDALLAEYGEDVKLTRDTDDELVDVFQSDWYKKTKAKMTPGTYVKIYRQNRHMTQVQLGALLGGLPRQHVSNMENGLRPISKKMALQLSRVFDVSAERFLAG